VDPVELMEAALALARSRVAYDGAVERDYAQPLCEFTGDADRLRAVLAILIVNAFEAMTERPGRTQPRLVLGLRMRVADRSGTSVRVDAEGGAAADDVPTCELVMSVSDNGPGVPAEIEEKIFYPFFTTKQRGSGVGLALAQKIVGSHGGALQLETRPESCTLHVHIPSDAEIASEPGP
jgi:two-component system nitrogen regulation sensor histidine kinase GlnL